MIRNIIMNLFQIYCAPDSDEYFGVKEYESHQGKKDSENDSSPVGVKSANNKFYLFKRIKFNVKSTYVHNKT